MSTTVTCVSATVTGSERAVGADSQARRGLQVVERFAGSKRSMAACHCGLASAETRFVVDIS